MAEPGSQRESATTDPEGSPEVKSKFPAKKKLPPIQDPSLTSKNFDRDPVFLVLASGQIESAEVSL